MKLEVWTRLGVGLLLASLAACGGQAATMDVAEVAAQPTVTAGHETLELDTETLTSPSELRARIDHPLVRPSLARIVPEPRSSWVFSAHPSSLTRTETRSAFRDASGEPYEFTGSVTSDPVGPSLITTMVSAGDPPLRYAP